MKRISLLLVLTAACGSAEGEKSSVDAGEEALPLQIEPRTHDFSPLSFGASSAAQSFVVTNQSDSPTTLTISTTGATADFVVDSSACDNASLGPDESCAFTVTFRPVNTAPPAGMRSLSIGVRDNVSGTQAVMTASATAQNPALTINTNGGGSIARSPESTDSCGPGCFRHPPGKVVLTPVPDQDKGLKSWTGMPCETGAKLDRSCEVDLTADTTLDAIFAKAVTFEIDFSGNGQVSNGTGAFQCTSQSAPCSQTFTVGDEILFFASRNGGGTNIRWRFNFSYRNDCKDNAQCKFTVIDGINQLIIEF